MTSLPPHFRSEHLRNKLNVFKPAGKTLLRRRCPTNPPRYIGVYYYYYYKLMYSPPDFLLLWSESKILMAALQAGSPDVDVVFVHGIRGGPFASWRSGTCPERSEAESSSRRFCWPGQWLSQDIPQARLLSLEYAAPASGWEVYILIQ